MGDLLYSHDFMTRAQLPGMAKWRNMGVTFRNNTIHGGFVDLVTKAGINFRLQGTDMEDTLGLRNTAPKHKREWYGHVPKQL